MTTREQLAEEYAKKLAELDKSEAIKALLPDSVIPKLKMVTIQHKSAPWIGFRNEGYGSDAGMTFKEAMEIFGAFKVVPMEHRKGNYTQIQPLSEYKAKDLEKSQFKGAYCADIRHDGSAGENSYFRMELVFYAMVGETLCRIYVQLKPVFHVKTTITRDRSNRMDSRVFSYNQILYAYSDAQVAYSCYEYGPVKKTWDHHFLFVADNEECTEFDHLRGVMQTLSAESNQEEWS